jgi:hypothetical protein
MRARSFIGVTLAVVGGAFAIGFATVAPAHGPSLSTPHALAAPRAIVSARPPARPADRHALPTVRRFEPPPLPADDPGVAEIVNGPDEPPAAVVAARWDDTDRHLDELFGTGFPAEKRSAIRTALTSWMREHGRVIRAYYRGHIDQAELTDHIHVNMLDYARSIESSLSRTEYRAFMDLEPGEDPFIVLVPPGTNVGDSLDRDKADGVAEE